MQLKSDHMKHLSNKDTKLISATCCCYLIQQLKSDHMTHFSDKDIKLISATCCCYLFPSNKAVKNILSGAVRRKNNPPNEVIYVKLGGYKGASDDYDALSRRTYR